MNKQFTISELAAEILKCNRCGTCQDVCPTYRSTLNEKDVARSRIRLVRMVLEGDLQWQEDDALADHIKSCLLCKACVSNCPASVPTDQIMMLARQDLSAVNGQPLFNRLAYRQIFSHPQRLAMLAELIRIYQRSPLPGLLSRTGFFKMFGTYGEAHDLLPAVSETLKRHLHDLPGPANHDGKKVIYFTGCAINLFYSRFGAASILMLHHNGCQVAVPEVKCCGGPHLSGGDYEEARRLARQNVDLLLSQEAEAIITDCATCSDVLLSYGKLLEGDEGYAHKARKVSDMVVDICHYLEELDPSTGFNRLELSISIHDPCHLVRGKNGPQRIPRHILARIPGLKITEMIGADTCCGGAGSFCVLNPALSRSILDRKIDAFAATGAETLVTSCPACAMQLEFGIRRHGLSAPVVHPIELVALALPKNV